MGPITTNRYALSTHHAVHHLRTNVPSRSGSNLLYNISKSQLIFVVGIIPLLFGSIVRVEEKIRCQEDALSLNEGKMMMMMMMSYYDKVNSGSIISVCKILALSIF